MEIARAPKLVGKSEYPDGYRNNEGTATKNYALYEPWEHMSPAKLKSGGYSNGSHPQDTQVNGGYPTGGYLNPLPQNKTQPPKLGEYPVSTKAAGTTPFNYHAIAAPARRVERPIHKGDRKDLARRPFNDPGTVRANTSLDNGHLVGVTYHPEGNTQGFVRAPMGPLDRETAQNMRQHQDMNSRPMIRKWDAAQRGKAWDENHPDANRRVMTIPGREQSSEDMSDAISGYTGGRRPNKWRRGKLEVRQKK